MTNNACGEDNCKPHRSIMYMYVCIHGIDTEYEHYTERKSKKQKAKKKKKTVLFIKMRNNERLVSVPQIVYTSVSLTCKDCVLQLRAKEKIVCLYGGINYMMICTRCLLCDSFTCLQHTFWSCAVRMHPGDRLSNMAVN